MKIAVWHNLVYGGGARALNYHLQGLLSRGHQIEIWSPNPLLDGMIHLHHPVKVHVIELKRDAHSAYKDRFNSVLFNRDVNINHMIEHSKKCADQINEGGFDILFANSCYFYAVPFICRYVQIRSVLYLGEPYRFLFEAHPRSFWEPPDCIAEKSKFSRAFYWEWLKDIWKISRARVQLREERINVEAAGKLLLNSVYSTESCARAYNRSGEVCYLGIDTTIFKPLPTRSVENYVLSVGAMYFHKNPELAIRAIALIKQNRPKFLWITNIKDAEYAEKIQRLAAQLMVEFEIREMITDEALVHLLNNAICMVYTAQLEPFGFAPLEANACATPVVGLRQGGVRETVIHGKTGFLCSPNAQEIAQRIEYFIQYPAEREKMGQYALENVLENWTMENATTRIEQAIEASIEPK